MADDEEVTQEVSNARDALDFVLSIALGLCEKAIEAVEATDGLAYAAFESEEEAQGYKWIVRASYGAAHAFVKVEGTPTVISAGAAYTERAFAQLLGNESAAFRVLVPRRWVEAALRQAAQVPTA